MESTKSFLPFWYFTTFSHGLMFAAVIPLVFLLKRSVDGLLKKQHGLDDKVLQLLMERHEAKITELNQQNKKLQDDLNRCRSSQHLTEQENKRLKGTIITLQRQTKGMEERIKVVNKLVNNLLNLSHNQKAHAGPNEMVTIQIEMESDPKEPKVGRKELMAQDKLSGLEHKIHELENKEESYKTRIATLETTAHKRLMKSSALQRQLMDKRTEVFFLHHRLMEYMDLVVELRGTSFAPLPLYPHTQRPTHKRVRDNWRTFLTRTHLHVIPEERGDFAPEGGGQDGCDQPS